MQPTGFPSPTSWPAPTSQISVVEASSLLLLDVLDKSLALELVLVPVPPLVLPEFASLLAAASAVMGGGVVVNGDVSVAWGP